ncbi:protein tyrosine phosphatase domain-containing protein 1 [Scleropages formosus]|uniref:protein tyrosine phosphatase domain-containing protein 1 n=1 Tax=Scleropages formosus TaxID=113540 RepID=UPI0008789B83|nr:protein tyrosine phosphatase domain-containing protein 1-like [Scleropages formosus]
MTLPVPVPLPSYSQARENLVKAIPHKVICLLACGGRDCRYEDPACWRPSQQAIKGIFSTWVTDDIVAMARPSTWLIKRYSIIDQFQKLSIKSIINMQLPGEHAHCGPPLEPDSGFSYSPQVFMENNIFFYNFGMPDFGVSSLSSVLDGVKVLSFSAKEGKVAVHCHAGLGRTGVLIACYLIYELRLSPSEAVHYVRIKRPRSIQTRAQINMVFNFARLLATQLVLYPNLGHRHGAPFSLQQHLRRQALLLHGEEARCLRSVPKVVDFLCGRLAALAWGHIFSQAGWVELQRRAAVLDLTKVVRDTLVVKKLLPILRDPGAQKNSASSVSSWDEPEGFLERKREVLLNKRSYSDSDLSKIALLEDMQIVQYPPVPEWGTTLSTTQDAKAQKQVPASSDGNAARKDRCNNHANKQSPGLQTKGSGSCPRRTKCTTKREQAAVKFTSSIELRKEQRCSNLVSVSQAVARAMAEQDPLGEDTLQRAAALQEELNGNECGWATLAMESNPGVLSCLLWTWLEKLREPVLSAADVDLLSSSTQGANSLSALRKEQHETISRLLGCVSQVTTLCPSLEDAVLLRLLRALTRCPHEEMMRCCSLRSLLKHKVREMRQDLLMRAVDKASRRSKLRAEHS